jgi:1-deoxy-D-xylulose-5-phosphate reductoisomerase
LQISDYKSLTFADPDTVKFRNLALAFKALQRGGNMPCILNAANEIAVTAFLDGSVGFMQMSEIVEFTMENSLYSPSPDLDFLESTDANARETAVSFINKLHKKR